MKGKWPKDQIDHKNGIRNDNRIDNLDDVSCEKNLRKQKLRYDNTSGVTGVSNWITKNGCEIWSAYIYTNGKKKDLGHFDNLEDAIKARKAADKKYGFHEDHGKKKK
jgi:hypothetical protein